MIYIAGLEAGNAYDAFRRSGDTMKLNVAKTKIKELVGNAETAMIKASNAATATQEAAVKAAKVAPTAQATKDALAWAEESKTWVDQAQSLLKNGQKEVKNLFPDLG